jgi:DUF4097 and DUF4098 domain-containing protein YvlB
MRVRVSFVVAGLALSAAAGAAQENGPRIVVRERSAAPAVEARVATHAYQGRDRGPEQTERFSKKIKLGRDGRVSVQNISGDITVTAGAGEDLSIEAVKRTRGGDQSQLASVHIDVDERSGRVDVRTTHTARNDRVSVEYTIVVPASASIDVRSVSGNLKVSGPHGIVRAETVSGTVTTADTPALEYAKSVSGDVWLTGVAAEGDLTAGSVSGNITAKGVKARGLDLGSVSGDVNVTDVTCERLSVKSVSGNVEYGGGIAKGGRYEINSHSGDVRLVLANPAGFELSASSFSGTIRSELPMTIGGDAERRDRETASRRRGMNDHSMHATFGDGSATITVRTFSGDVVIAKR